MEEFDRQIKSKIDSLAEVPGIKFDEERVWKKIKLNPSLGPLSFIVPIFLLSFLSIGFLYKHWSQRNHIRQDQIEESISEVLIDSNSVQSKKARLFIKTEIQGADSVIGLRSELNDESKNSENQVTSIQGTKKKLLHKQSESLYEFVDDGQENARKKEFFVSVGKGSHTLGITRLRELNNRFLLTYGIQINRNFAQVFETNEGVFMSSEINQIEVPIGVRYNFFTDERQFKLHAYAGLTNSFSLPNTIGTDYNLKFDSNISFDYRIFSTKDGKEAYLRFRLPIYNKNIINKGVYKPSLYDVLKQ